MNWNVGCVLQLVHPDDVDDEELLAAPERRAAFLAYFFGSKNYAWVKRGTLRDTFASAEPSTDDRELHKGFEDARRYLEEYGDLIADAARAVPQPAKLPKGSAGASDADADASRPSAAETGSVAVLRDGTTPAK